MLQDAIVEAARKSLVPRICRWSTPLSAGAPWTARSTDRRTAREEAASDVTEICWFDDRIEQQETARLIDHTMKPMPENFAKW